MLLFDTDTSGVFSVLPSLILHTESRSLPKPDRLKSMYAWVLSQNFIRQQRVITGLSLATLISLFADSGPEQNTFSHLKPQCLYTEFKALSD